MLQNRLHPNILFYVVIAVDILFMLDLVEDPTKWGFHFIIILFCKKLVFPTLLVMR